MTLLNYNPKIIPYKLGQLYADLFFALNQLMMLSKAIDIATYPH